MDQEVTRRSNVPAKVLQFSERYGLNEPALLALQELVRSVDRDRWHEGLRFARSRSTIALRRMRESTAANPRLMVGGMASILAGIAMLAMGVRRTTLARRQMMYPTV